jgi:hypothetical protein
MVAGDIASKAVIAMPGFVRIVLKWQAPGTTSR